MFDEMLKRLNDLGIRSYWITESDDTKCEYSVTKPGIRVLTSLPSLGLEFNVVLLLWVEQFSDCFPSQCNGAASRKHRCVHNPRNPHLPCAVHPNRITDNRCLNFKLDATLPVDEWWEPEGASYYDNELVINPIQRWTREQQIPLLDYHPMFTGRCPNCEQTMLQT